MPGGGRRERLGQEPDLHDRHGAVGPQRPGRRLDPLPGPRAAGPEDPGAEPAARLEDDHDLPGPADRPDPAHAHRRADRRAAAPPPGPGRGRIQGARPAVAGQGAHPRRRPPHEPVSARAVRRHAPAGDDRRGHGLRPGAADRRRADHGAGRHRPGRDPRPDGRSEGRDPGGHGADHPRHGGHRPPGRPGVRDEGWPLCRGRAGRSDLRRAAHRLRPRPAGGDPAPGPRRPRRSADCRSCGRRCAGGGRGPRHQGLVPRRCRPVRRPADAAGGGRGQFPGPRRRDPWRGRRKRLRQVDPVARGPEPGGDHGGRGHRARPRHHPRRPGGDARRAQGPADRLPGPAGQPRSADDHRRFHRRAAARLPPRAGPAPRARPRRGR